MLVTGGMEAGLPHRLKQKGILVVVTTETDPDRAVAAYLDGTLPLGIPEGSAHDPEHHHGHPHRGEAGVAPGTIPKLAKPNLE